MTTTARAFAIAVQDHITTAGAAEPSVRGADWRTAVVATVAGDGTVTTADGIVARCLASYLVPTIGDTVVVSQSSAGAWLVLGVMASAAPAWTAYTPTFAGLSAMGSSTSSGRYQRNGSTVHAVAVLTWGTGSSLGAGTITVSLPIAASSVPTGNHAWVGIGRHTGNDGTTWKELRARIVPGGTVATVYGIRQSDLGWQTPGQVSYPWAVAGANMAVQITYEV